MTQLVQLHRLRLELKNHVERLRGDAQFFSLHSDVRKRYDPIICKAERVLRDIDCLTAELLQK